MLGKFSKPKDFIEWAIQEYISNNLTDDELKSYQFMKDQLDTAEMMKREIKKK